MTEENTYLTIEDLEKNPQMKFFETEEELLNKKHKLFLKRIVITGFFLGTLLSIGIYFYNRSILWAIILFIGIPLIFFLFYYFSNQLAKLARIKRNESVFPDFLQLMSSNLRAGITIDRSIFLSSRPEFAPLDLEIFKTGKDITTGMSVENALVKMGERIGSKKIEKILYLIITGIKAGGNLATLLEETSIDMREKDFVEKRASSNVLMYVIFIFISVSFGSPALFAFSSVLVEILTKLLAGIPKVEAGTATSMPFALSSVSLSVSFVFWFCLLFILITDLLASLTLGLVSKGSEKEGLKYFIPMVSTSLTVFFTIRFFLSRFMAGLFG
jgi:Flp pilus assembly protein TadB